LTELRRSSDDSNVRFHSLREVPRFAIAAPVDLTELLTGEHVPGQLSEISRKGCFIEVSRTFLIGTPVNVVIFREDDRFETAGAVIYARPGEGIGVAFRYAASAHLAILDAWLGATISACFFMPTTP
jgi:PilZ domain